MAHTREKLKSRKGSGRFAGIPHAVMDHPDYATLSANAVRLLLELLRQYNGYNNGDLSATFSVLKKRGFGSKGTIAKVLQELEQRGFLICTRSWKFLNPGGRCALFAVTWQRIDECPGKELEVMPTRKPARCFSADVIKIPMPKIDTSGAKNCD